LLYSSTATIANATLVSKEMRDAFSMCKDELVTKLLHLRSPRMAQAMKLIAKQKGVSTCTVGEITALYRHTVEVETQKCGSFTQPASLTQLATPAAVDFNEVVISFELTPRSGGGWPLSGRCSPRMADSR